MEPNSANRGGLVEARIAHLESDVSHLRSDVSEMKVDLRSLRDKVDVLRTEIASVKHWGLAFGMTLAGVMLTVMARGFGWL